MPARRRHLRLRLNPQLLHCSSAVRPDFDFPLYVPLVTIRRVCAVTLLAVSGIGIAPGCGTSKPAAQHAISCSPTSGQNPKAASLSLPALFPTPRGITYGPVTTNSATTLIHANSSSTLRVTFDLYRRDLGSNPYTVTSSRFNGNNGAINFTGSGVNGKIELASGCRGLSSVDITLQQAAVSGQ